jgi:hypothetical protein
MFADKADKHVATTCQDLHSTQLVTHDLYTHTSRQIINTGIMPEDNAVLITAGPYQFLAKFEGEAPKTVATFRKLLPYRQKIIHVRWSGEAVWIPLGDADFKLEFENHTAHPAAGQILFYPGGFSETELLFCYGNVAFASKMGALAANHFLTITEGQENLKALGKLVLYKGAKDVLFEVADQVKYAHI